MKDFYFDLPMIQPGTELEIFSHQTGSHATAAALLAERYEEAAQRLRALSSVVEGKDIRICGEVHDIFLRCEQEDIQGLVDQKLAVEVKDDFDDETEDDEPEIVPEWDPDPDDSDDGLDIPLGEAFVGNNEVPAHG